MMQKQ